MPVNNKGITSGLSRIVDQNGVMNPQFRGFLVQLINSIGVSGFAAPTGAPSNNSINANWTTTVSNPPTQAEVTAIRDQLIAVQKAVAQLIIDLSRN